MHWNEIIEQDEDDMSEMILKELKENDYPSGDFQHEVYRGVSVQDFNDEYIEFNVLQERVENWTEWSEHVGLVEYRMRILNKPTPEDWYNPIWDYQMVNEFDDEWNSVN